MYERPDVPTPGPRRTAGAVAVLVCLAVAAAVGLPALWRLANETNASTIGDAALASAVAAVPAEAAVPDGAEATGDEVECYLVLTVDDVRAAGPELLRADLLAVDRTTSSSRLVELPLDLRVRGADGLGTSLGALFASAGASGCVAPVAGALGLPVAHVLELDGEGWGLVEDVVSQGMTGVAQTGPKLLSSLKTDLDTQAVMELPERLRGVGLGSLEAEPCPVTPTDEGPVADVAALGRAVGTLRS